MKKMWQVPKLVVLVRARPEESILINCKTVAGPTAGPDDWNWYCQNSICDRCNAEAFS